MIMFSYSYVTNYITEVQHQDSLEYLQNNNNNNKKNILIIEFYSNLLTFTYYRLKDRAPIKTNKIYFSYLKPFFRARY